MQNSDPPKVFGRVMQSTLLKSCQINSLDNSKVVGLCFAFISSKTVDQGLQSFSFVDYCVQKPTADLSAQWSHFWNRHPLISGERGLSFVSAACFPLFGAVLSTIVNLIIVRINLQSKLVKEDMLVCLSITQYRGDTRGGMSVGGPRSLQRPLDLQEPQYLRRGVAGENPHARSSVPVQMQATDPFPH